MQRDWLYTLERIISTSRSSSQLIKIFWKTSRTGEPQIEPPRCLSESSTKHHEQLVSSVSLLLISPQQPQKSEKTPTSQQDSSKSCFGKAMNLPSSQLTPHTAPKTEKLHNQSATLFEGENQSSCKLTFFNGKAPHPPQELRSYTTSQQHCRKKLISIVANLLSSALPSLPP
jgi:hypothetical protein